MQVRNPKKISWLALGAALIQLFSVQVLADDTQDTQSADAGETEPINETVADGAAEVPSEDDYFPVLDEAELSAMVADFMAERGMTENNSSVSFCYTGTGETWNFNGDMYINGASLYKLSLMMGLARKVAAGELSQEDTINGMTISYIEMRSLTYSDNAVSEQIIEYFSPFRSYRLMQAEIAGVKEEDLPVEYFSSNTFSANFMLGVLQELYNNTEKYPNVIECMLDANPGEYYRRSLDGKYTVAQKYGGGDGYLHTAAIIYTPTPCLVTVMTYHVSNAEAAIAGLGELLAEYAVTLDQRTKDHYAELERQAEEARRAEEEARLAAEAAEQERLRLEEEARRAEEEARLAEEAAQKAQEAAAAPKIDGSAIQEPEATPSSTPLKIVVIVLAVLLVVLIPVYIASLFRRQRTRV